MSRSLVMLCGVVVCACGAATGPELSMNTDRATIDGRVQRAIITLSATTQNGAPGTGTVSLASGVGAFVEGNEVTLVDGVATATFRCDPNEESACDGAVRLGATWGQLSATVQVRVTPSSPVLAVKWKVIPTLTLETLNDVVIGPNGAYWAVGSGGVVLTLVDGGWVSVPSNVTTTLRAAWSDGTHLAVVGDQDTFLVWNGKTFDALALHSGDDFTAVAGTATSLIAVTKKGRVAHSNGSTVAFEWLGDDVLNAVAQNTAGETWILGEKNWYRSQEASWATVAPPVLGNWRSARFGPDGLWVGGARDTQNGPSGVVLTGPTPAWSSSTVVANEVIQDIFFVTGSEERFALTDSSVFRKPGSSDWEEIETPMGGLAIAGRSGNDIMIVGQGGVSIRRVQ